MLPRLRQTLHHLCRAVSTSTTSSKATMTTFTLPSSTPPCPVHLPSTADGPTQDELLSFTAFKNWTSTLQHSLSLQHSNKNHPFHASPYFLRKIEVQSVDRFGGGRLGFVKLKAEVKNDKDESLPGSVFLRGGSVGMLVRYATCPLLGPFTVTPPASIASSPARSSSTLLVRSIH